MDRRARNRIPAANRKLFKKMPAFVLIVSATVSFSAEAMAKIQNAESRPVILVKDANPDVYTKTYTKDELKKTMPQNPIVGLNTRLMAELSGLINGIGSAFSGSEQRTKLDALKTLTPDEDDVNLHIAALRDAPTTRKANQDDIRQFLGGEAQKVASSKVKSKMPFLGAIGSGFNFNLDFDSFFGESKSKNEKSGNIRYSLILKDIKPAKKGDDRAAISDIADEMQYAGHADVEWTIGPLMEEHNRKILSEPPMELDQKKQRSFFGLRIPKFAFKGSVKPENFDNITKVSKDSMPTWRFDLSQVEGFYSMIHTTKFKGEKLSTEHLFRTPVAGTIEVGRRFSDNFEVLQTSAYNILYDKRMPLLSVHYLNVQERYSADLGKKVGGANISLTARTEAKGKVDKEEDRPRNYSLNVTKSF